MKTQCPHNVTAAASFQQSCVLLPSHAAEIYSLNASTRWRVLKQSQEITKLLLRCHDFVIAALIALIFFQHTCGV